MVTAEDSDDMGAAAADGAIAAAPEKRSKERIVSLTCGRCG